MFFFTHKGIMPPRQNKTKTEKQNPQLQKQQNAEGIITFSLQKLLDYSK